MKGKIFIAAAMMALTLAMPTAARDKYTDVGSVRVTVNTSSMNLAAGDSLPSFDSSWITYPDTSSTGKYYLGNAEWYNESFDNTLKVGDQPMIKVTLYVREDPYKSNDHDGYTDDYYYRFNGSYGSGSVSIKGGSLVKASRYDSGQTLELIIRINGLKGEYPSPDNAYWTNTRGVAKWAAVKDGSGCYEVWLRRGSSVIKKIDFCQGTTYNFYPYMTKSGNYNFQVRTVPYTEDQKRYGSNSEWSYSGDLYIDENEVSDGSGQTDDSGLASTGSYPNGTGNAVTAGWIKNGNKWFFRYPNGNYLKSQWLDLEGKWYRFGADGTMLTGWFQNEHGNWYYLNSDGAMRTGWLHDGKYWYYLNTTNDAFLGSMLHNCWWEVNGKKYYFNEQGIMVTGWYSLKNSSGKEKWYYFYPEGSTEGAYGYLAVNTKIGVFKVGADGAWIQ